MKYVIHLLSIIIVALFLIPPATAQPGANEDDNDFEFALQADLGFVTPLYHRIQFSEAGTEFDYVDEGGQEVLFPFRRFRAEARFNDRHHVAFLYQPLRLETRVLLGRDVTIDEAVFDEGTPMELLYNFPYYRTTYLYDLVAADGTELSVGAALQIRNATIDFQSADGELLRANRDLGFVPLLQIRGHHRFDNDWFVGGEIAGFYAPIRYLNLSDSDVIGAIADANVELGHQLQDEVDAYLSARYIGGGADGTSDQPAQEPGDGYTRNWIHAIALSLGLEYRF